jgi:hypothetical protein
MQQTSSRSNQKNMNDITKCVTKKCLLREKCIRASVSFDEYQSYAQFNPDDKDEKTLKCKYFLEETNE